MKKPIAPSSLASLAMFPLPDTVLFPGTALPLHVFEQRYCAMARDAIAGDGLLAIARLQPGYEDDYQGRPAVFDVVSIGAIVAHDELEGGRYNILVQGIARARIDSELPPKQLYRRIRATLLDDEASARVDEIVATHAQLVALCERIAGPLGEQGEQLNAIVQTMESPGRCADLVVAALVGDPDERQELLAMIDPADRLDAAVRHVARIAREVGGDGPSMLQ